jgi:ferritin-like metal-binding protein YciE
VARCVDRFGAAPDEMGLAQLVISSFVMVRKMQGGVFRPPLPLEGGTMEITTLRDLFQEHIQDLWSMEDQIINTLPDMIEATSDTDLRAALQNHLDQTRMQVQRLEEICRLADIDHEGDRCEGMRGILKEGDKLVEKDVEDDDVRDAAIIAAAQRVEHYEIAVYGTAKTFARMLGEEEAAHLLEQSLEEEKNADSKLTEIAEAHVNRRAMASGD